MNTPQPVIVFNRYTYSVRNTGQVLMTTESQSIMDADIAFAGLTGHDPANFRRFKCDIEFHVNHPVQR